MHVLGLCPGEPHDQFHEAIAGHLVVAVGLAVLGVLVGGSLKNQETRIGAFFDDGVDCLHDVIVSLPEVFGHVDTVCVSLAPRARGLSKGIAMITVLAFSMLSFAARLCAPAVALVRSAAPFARCAVVEPSRWS